MKLWIDDVRPAPDGYDYWSKSVYNAIEFIKDEISFSLGCDDFVLLLDIDHDAGDYAKYGGDYIEILKWLEERGGIGGVEIQVHIHSMNPVGIQNMRAIIHKNGWKEVRYNGNKFLHDDQE